MPRFTKKQVFILPHAEEYRRQYHVSIDDVLLILNEPEEQEGLASDTFTASRVFENSRVFLDYYITLPVQGDGDMVVGNTINWILRKFADSGKKHFHWKCAP